MSGSPYLFPVWDQSLLSGPGVRGTTCWLAIAAALWQRHDRQYQNKFSGKLPFRMKVCPPVSDISSSLVSPAL